MKAKPKKKRLVRGKDWHAWALMYKPTKELSFYATYERQKGFGYYKYYKAVRVKFVEVKS